jgi:hypothetical protein
MDRIMVEGVRDLEKEILETFFEEIEEDEDIPESVTQELKLLEEASDLTDASKITKATRESLEDVH